MLTTCCSQCPSVFDTDATRHGLPLRRSYVAPRPRSRTSAKQPKNELTCCLIYSFKFCVSRIKDLTPALFCARDVALWRWCAGHLRVCRAPFVPVGQPAYCCHLNLLGRERWQFHHERNSCMTTVSPLLNLASDLLRRSSTILSYFNVSQSRFVSAQPEARHD